MYCMYCGAQIPVESKFCLQCGKPVTGIDTGIQTPSVIPDPNRKEYCDIVYETKLGWNLLMYCRFWGKAAGPNGSYTAATGKWVIGVPYDRPLIDALSMGKKQTNALDDLIDDLVQSGWELIDSKGSGWWSYRFRRALRTQC